MLIVLVTRRRRSPRAAYVMPPPRYSKTPVVATNARAYEKAPLLPTVQQNAALVEEVSANCQMMSDDADNLQKQVHYFKH